MDVVKKVCVDCTHQRDQHSREGCTWPGCACTVKNMDRDKFVDP